MTDLKTMNEPTISLKDLLDLVEKIETRINSYWNFYTVVLIAIGGWIVSGNTIDSLRSIGISIALGAFFLANYTFIRTNENRLIAVESEIKSVAEISEIKSGKFGKFLFNPSVPNRQTLSFILHICIDIIAILLVLYKGHLPPVIP
jgi:hypothetical protein